MRYVRVYTTSNQVLFEGHLPIDPVKLIVLFAIGEVRVWNREIERFLKTITSSPYERIVIEYDGRKREIVAPKYLWVSCRMLQLRHEIAIS